MGCLLLIISRREAYINSNLRKDKTPYNRVSNTSMSGNESAATVELSRDNDLGVHVLEKAFWFEHKYRRVLSDDMVEEGKTQRGSR